MVRERGGSGTNVVAPPEVVARVARAPQPGEAPLPVPNAAVLLRRNGTDPDRATRPALRFGPRIVTHGELYRQALVMATVLRRRLDPKRPPHVAVLLDNTPEYVIVLCAAGLMGACLVGLNHTRRDEHLARDITYTDVQMVITEPRHQDLLAPIAAQLELPGGLL
ncbi:MAG TPA: AMP-binding protein, partial [Acidimicrobiales bacterium]|nr:AMP-binding protein [Acidimicrobiales bacterium]